MSGSSTTEAHWFDAARLGLFVHFDASAQRGWELSWPMVGGVFSLPYCQDVPAAEYHALAASFDPQGWDPEALAATARRAGMRYVVFGARHHAGFSMFATEQSDYSIMHTPYGRDILLGLVDACRAEGLRIGIYYSLSDWHHPDYPAWHDGLRPYRFGSSPPLPTEEQRQRFLAYLRAQLTELLTGYGRIDVVWFDGGWERPTEWWEPEAIEALIRRLQPAALINDRLPGAGDFATPEQFVPAVAPTGRWEACMTMNESWGYNVDDPHYKTPRAIVHALCETAGRGGNLLLNVSPRGDGRLPLEQADRLDALGRWLDANGEAIYATGAGLDPWQFYGPSTRRDRSIYLFCLSRPYDIVTVRGLPVRRITRAVHVATGKELSFTVAMPILEMLVPDPAGEVRIELPAPLVDDLCTVLRIDVGDEP